MKLSEIGKPEHREMLERISSDNETRDEYRGMKVYQLEMNAFEMHVAKAVIRALHAHHNEFYELEQLSGDSIEKVVENCLMIGLSESLMIKHMMEEMVEDDVL